MLIKNVMTKNPVIISDDCSLTDAKALMTKNNISRLPVVDKNKKLVGILSKGDLQKASPSDATTLDIYEISYLLSKLTVEKIMVRNVVTVPDDEVVETAARIMVEHGVSCLPVMSGDFISGIITESDVFRLFTEMFGAHQSGVRMILSMDDKPGQVAKLVNGIAAINGNVVSMVTRELTEATKRRLTIKVSGITREQAEKVLSDCGFTADDIRVN